MLRFGSQKYHITRGFLCKKKCNKVLGNNFKTILKVKRWSKLPTFTVPYVLGVSLSTTTSVGVQDVSLSTTSSMNVQGECLHTPSCVDVQGDPFSTFVQFFYAITPDVWHLIILVPEWKRMSMPELASPVTECSSTGLRCWISECRCRWHQPKRRCPAMPDSN